MEIYDVSVPLSTATPTYPGDPGIEIKPWKEIANGDPSNVSLIHFGLHSGTHVDAPAHFIEGGTRLENLPLESLIGEAEVVVMAERIKVIDQRLIDAYCTRGSKKILFKTRNSSFWDSPEDGFRADFTYFDAGASRRLVDLGVQLVGIDYLSVEGFATEHYETHHILLSNNIVILEGLDLRKIAGGLYELICLPLKISGGNGDGAPARTILRTLNQPQESRTSLVGQQ